tara:strand:+ start:256 stop:1527 length:1272 start_codon:yes stop_codon:yes gene_type:complete
MSQQILTVSELNNQINNLVESRFSRIIVKGEISGLKPPPHNHMYFNIKDDSSSLPCAIWSYKQKLTDYIPKDGDEVLIEGKPSFWIKGGALKFHIDKISLAGEGDLWAKFQALKKKLLAEGLFDSVHKKELPKYPRKIAVITSITGSVIQDILDVISRNSSYLHVTVINSRMQGDEAVKDLIHAIDDVHNANIGVDVIIIARGGGSLEDLWCFNDEKLAYRIYNSSIPIISAIGHETDTSIADLVSDKRAGTPSIAAKIVAPSSNECLQNLDYFYNGINDIIKNKIEKYFILLNNVNQRHGLHKAKYVLLNHHDKFKRIKKSITLNNLKKMIDIKNNQLILLNKNIQNRFMYMIKENNTKIKYLENHITLLNPQNIMKRGYSIVYNKKDQVVKDVKNIKDKEKLNIKLYVGEIEVQNLKSTKK